MGAVFGIEIAGGLVGKDDRRLQDEGTGQSDPLLFTAGELDGVMMDAIGESDTAQQSDAVARPFPPPFSS